MPKRTSADRPSADVYFSYLARLVSIRATCVRRAVGCVLVNRRNHILATGYNGVAAGMPHCLDVPCPGADCESGTGLELCEAIHAEQNALLQCSNVHDIATVYTTTAPCITCTKLLLNTSAHRVVFTEPYSHKRAEELWVNSGRIWECLDSKPSTLVLTLSGVHPHLFRT